MYKLDTTNVHFHIEFTFHTYEYHTIFIKYS